MEEAYHCVECMQSRILWHHILLMPNFKYLYDYYLKVVIIQILEIRHQPLSTTQFFKRINSIKASVNTKCYITTISLAFSRVAAFR